MPDEDLRLDEDEDYDDQPEFQKAAHEGGGAAMVVKEADKETAGENKGVETAAAPAGAPPEMPDADGKPSAKAVLCGDSGVGKTSLLVRFSQNLFASSKATIGRRCGPQTWWHGSCSTREPSVTPSAGVDLQTQLLALPGGTTLKLQVWDTAGQEQFQSLTSSYFRRAHAVVLVYDVNNRASFNALARWMGEIDRLAPVEVCKMVVGAKSDTGVVADVSEAEAADFAAKHGALCERCSARDATNVREMFERLGAKIVRNGFDPDGKQRSSAANGRVSLSGAGAGAKGSGSAKKKGCC